jgi:citrate lyase subunit beta/citryl-CoA lyase
MASARPHGTGPARVDVFAEPEMISKLKRSVLAMPGSNARALEKGKDLAADVLMFELEDGVAEPAKELARRQVADAVVGGGYGARQIVVRVNVRGSEWYKADIAAIAPTGPDAIVIPKVNAADDVFKAAADIVAAGAPPGTRIWAMIETPRAIFDIEKIAGAAEDSASRLEALVLGPNDIAKSTRARLTPGRAPLLSWLSAGVLAARVHNIEIIDGIYNDFNDESGLRREAEQGRDMGFDGKMLIHPNQIGPVNEIFAPDTEEIAFARQIIAIFDLPENADRGVVQIDGRMVERLHLDIARRTLALVEAVG